MLFITMASSLAPPIRGSPLSSSHVPTTSGLQAIWEWIALSAVTPQYWMTPKVIYIACGQIEIFQCSYLWIKHEPKQQKQGALLFPN